MSPLAPAGRRPRPRTRPHRRRRPLARLLRRLRPAEESLALRLAAALLLPLEPLSRLAHDRLFDDVSQSLCARGWWLRDADPFWRAWVKVFGPEHCRAAFHHHHGRAARTPAAPRDA